MDIQIATTAHTCDFVSSTNRFVSSWATERSAQACSEPHFVKKKKTPHTCDFVSFSAMERSAQASSEPHFLCYAPPVLVHGR